MDWSALDRALAEHAPADEAEKQDVARVRAFLREHPADAHLRSQQLGHLTGSGFVLDASRERVLLLHHGKLKRWLQPGGHGEGELVPLEIALREVMEETGLHEGELQALSPKGAGAREARLFDVDIHRIPARKDEPEHAHLDLRFAWVAKEGAAPGISAESSAMEWFSLDAPPDGADPAMLRAFAKLKAAGAPSDH